MSLARAGAMRHRVSLQAATTTQDSFGQQSTTFVEALSCWADIQPMSGRDLIVAQAENSETTHSVTIRYRPGVTQAMRLVYQGRIFDIHSIIDPEERHFLLVLMCGEGLNQG